MASNADQIEITITIPACEANLVEVMGQHASGPMMPGICKGTDETATVARLIDVSQ